MAGSTTKGIPYPLPTDLASGGADAMAAIANDLDLTKIMLLDPAVIVSATLQTSYPLGISALTVSSAQGASGGWPTGGTGQIVTFRWTTDRAVQYFYRNNFNTQEVFYRVMGSSNGAWVQVPVGANASGVVTVNITTANTPASAAVTFPAGRFTKIPRIILSSSTSAPQQVSVGATGASTTGFTAWATRTVTGGVTATWVASDVDVP